MASTTARLMTVFHVGGCACSALMAAAFAATGSGRLTSTGLPSLFSGCLPGITSCFHPVQPCFSSRRHGVTSLLAASFHHRAAPKRHDWPFGRALAAPVHPAAIRESKTWAEHDAAVRAAWMTGGILAVRDNIVVPADRGRVVGLACGTYGPTGATTRGFDGKTEPPDRALGS